MGAGDLNYLQNNAVSDGMTTRAILVSVSLFAFYLIGYGIVVQTSVISLEIFGFLLYFLGMLGAIFGFVLAIYHLLFIGASLLKSNGKAKRHSFAFVTIITIELLYLLCYERGVYVSV